EYFRLDVTDCICLDAGASTGGFTDCLLQHGAKKVYAVDVGHAQLHEKMQRHPQVVNMEGVNLRYADEDLLPEKVDVMVSDVSFISLTLIIPPCLKSVKENGLVVCLIKPQFEVGAHQTDKGVVRDEAVRQEAVSKVLTFCENLGLECLGVTPAMIKGPKGNQEYVACWRKKVQNRTLERY
ncbi:MAG: TlyA family RNA methyltransferase, partial [Mailhella sp.]|nr:TlyA family RNA methyltransferase [Mailhella sp.]